MLADILDMSGPLDDLYHLNRLAGAASIGSGFDTLTTFAVSSGTSCSVAEVARLDMEGEPDGWVRILLVNIPPRLRDRESCICST